jgi:hypothetical protein
MSAANTDPIINNTVIIPVKKDIDFGSLWTWTVPLWGLLVIVFFLVGVINETVVLQALPSMKGGGGGKRVRFLNT